MTLHTVSQALAEHLGETPASGRQEKLERWGKIAGLTGLSVLIFAIAAYFIGFLAGQLFGLNADFFLNSILPVIASVAIPLILVGAGLVLSPSLIKEPLHGGSSKRRLTQPQAERTAALPPAADIEQASSITEGTTRHLDTGVESMEEKSSGDTQPGLTPGPD